MEFQEEDYTPLNPKDNVTEIGFGRERFDYHLFIRLFKHSTYSEWSSEQAKLPTSNTFPTNLLHLV